MNKSLLIKEQALLKMKQYCAYQERCCADVKEKLHSLKLNNQEIEEIIASLVQENYLNEERFSVQFARGKFNLKKWGRIKIKHALKQKQINENLIKKAINQIPESEYKKTLNKLTAQKNASLKGAGILNKQKMYNYLIQKGYESTLIKEIVGKGLL